ncbi:hypothetical protein LTR93_011313 [Exophiala xenobiotica]|nr:hypothetical protein LTR93_011313 [Exophiala xenobiotica]
MIRNWFDTASGSTYPGFIPFTPPPAIPTIPNEEIRRFHDTIDVLKIEGPLDGRSAAEPYPSRLTEFVSPERALVAKFISLSLENSTDAEALGGKPAFISALVELCRQQDGQRYPGVHRHRVTSVDLDRQSIADTLS